MAGEEVGSWVPQPHTAPPVSQPCCKNYRSPVSGSSFQWNVPFVLGTRGGGEMLRVQKACGGRD